MIIPKTYTQFGRTFKVVPEKSSHLSAYNGIAHPDQNLVVLDMALPRTLVEHNFIHEMLHNQMSLMQKFDLYNDENFINTLSGLIHQALTTGKGSI